MPYVKFNTALIVGAGSGLSAALARALHSEGIKVALAARSTGDLAELAKETGAAAFTCDASKRADVDKLFADLDAGPGAPDIVIYNPSYRTRGPIAELDPEAVRAFAHIDGAVTAQAFAQALKEGHAYVTFGPLIFPSVMFGDELKVRPGEPFTLGFDLKSVAGVKQAELIGSGVALKTESLQAPAHEVHVEFPLTTQRRTWYSLIVEDQQGHKAYTDPIWVDAVNSPFGP